METFCRYCSHVDQSPCARRIEGYYCTRERGHKGPCVACGADADHHDLTGAAPVAPVVSAAPIIPDSFDAPVIPGVPDDLIIREESAND